MGRLLLTAAAALACAGLAGCNGNAGTGGGGNSGVCKPFTAPPAANAPGASAAVNAQPGAAPVAPETGGVAGLDDCLHRWGYALAPSADPANIVGQAVVAACSDQLTSWNQAGMATGGVQAPSLVTGETTNPMAEHHLFAQGRALFYVVEARAGHCAGPPVDKGQMAAR